ncbi:MAG: hypothetical protein IPM79_21465 [Polyangiaceae bacterium]|nr:hypothetical protein [Polyangiaceae bacterium]
MMRDVARALWAGESALELVGTLVLLAREAEEGSTVWRFAHRELALAVAETDPWRASLVSRRLLELSPNDHVGWATLALAQSLLGNLAYAVRCYERAIALSPHQPRYAHNLGHLYDVALDDPEKALPLLERAHRAEPRCSHVASSYAHALGRAGRPEDALLVLRGALRDGATRDQAALLRWLEQQAQPTRRASAHP